MINKVTLIGNLGKEPEVRTFDNGSKVARFSLATNENYQDKNGDWQTITEWHNIVCWRYLADRVESQLKKGHLVYIEGKISYRKWEDTEGKERYTTDIVASTFRLLEKRDGTSSGYSSIPSPDDEPAYLSDRSSGTGTFSDSTSKTSQPIDDKSMEEDDLPF